MSQSWSECRTGCPGGKETTAMSATKYLWILFIYIQNRVFLWSNVLIPPGTARWLESVTQLCSVLRTASYPTRKVTEADLFPAQFCWFSHLSLICVLPPGVSRLRRKLLSFFSVFLWSEVCTGCFILKMNCRLYAIPGSDFLPGLNCSASIKNRLDV